MKLRFLPYRFRLTHATVLFGVIGVSMVLFACAISLTNGDRRFSDINTIPRRHVALILGTTPALVGGGENLYFKDRIQAGAELLFSRKVDVLLLSGDNRTSYYNEPEMMRRALLSLGVASSSIVLDYAGRDTLDSMIRARDVFGVEDPIVVTQRFHADRALAIGRYEGMNPIAYVAQERATYPTRARMYIREVFARIKMAFELIGERGAHVTGEPAHIK